MKRYTIKTKRTYGENKTAWCDVGMIIKFEATNEKPEAIILELNMFPNQKFYVFEQKPREQANQVSESVGEPVVDLSTEPF